MHVILTKATQGGFMSPCSVFFFSMLRDEFIFFNGGEVHQPSYDQLNILKSRAITLPTKVCLVKVMVFPVVMYGCESWTIKKAEH